MIRIEALSDALAKLNSYQDPSSSAYQLRNPGMLRSFSSKHTANPDGYRVFDRAVNGLQALINDLEVKCSGHSRAQVTGESLISDLLVCYSLPKTSTDTVITFLRHALPEHASAISRTTKLSFFLEAN